MTKVNIENFDLLSPKFERENIQLGLSRIKKALKELNNPCKNIPAIQIVGTNGKGSVTSFLRSIFEFSNYKVHTYTSPHLINFNERIRINSKLISNYHPNTLLEAIINAFIIDNKTGIIFFLSDPSRRKNVKKIRFKIDTGLPPWNIPFEVPSNL